VESVVRGHRIPPDIQTELEALDSQVVDALKEKDSKKVLTLFSSGFLERTNIETIDSNFTEAGFFIRNNTFRYLDRFYILNPYRDNYDTILSGRGDYRYILHNHYGNEEMFISLILVKFFQDDILLTLNYGKYEKGWKLDNLHFGIINIIGRNAVDYFYEARSYADSGFMIDASNAMYLAMQCLTPSGTFFQYLLEDDIFLLRDRISMEVGKLYPLPYRLEMIRSTPEVFNIYPHKYNGKYYPMIRYLTGIKLWDYSGLERENQEIQRKIGDIFPGIDKNNKLIFYRALNEIPTGEEKVMHYGFVQEIK